MIYYGVFSKESGKVLFKGQKFKGSMIKDQQICQFEYNTKRKALFIDGKRNKEYLPIIQKEVARMVEETSSFDLLLKRINKLFKKHAQNKQDKRDSPKNLPNIGKKGVQRIKEIIEPMGIYLKS